MRSNFSLRTATAVVGALGLVAVGLGQAVPTPNWTADSATLSGHAAGPVLDTRLSPNGTYVASIVTKAGTAGGLEIRVRNASDGTFLWSADMGPAPAAGLPRIAFSNDSSRLYFSSDADAGAPFDGQLEAKVPATGANVAGFPINDVDTDFIKTRAVTSPNGTWYAYEDARQPAANIQPQIIIRPTGGGAVYARVNIGGGGGPYPDIRDFQFTNNATDGELIVALTDGNFYKVNLFSGVTVSYSATTGSSVNRIERIPGDTTNFMVARESGTTLESLTYAAGATTRSYTNVPTGAKRGFAFAGTNSGTGAAYMMVAVGLFDFPTYVRVDTGDRVSQFDLRRTGQPAADSRMNAVAAASNYNGIAYFGALGTERVLSVNHPSYNMDISPVSFIGGTSTTGKIILPGVAPAGGYLVNMTYGANTSGPATVTVPAAASEQTFTINSLTVDASTPVTVTATFPHFADNDSVTLTPVLVTAVTISPDPAPNATTSTGSVTLNAPVTSNRVVSLTWDPAGNFAVAPASVTVLSGSDTANFTFKSNVIPAGFAASVTGALNGSSILTNFNVAPVSLQGVWVYPYNAYVGQKVFGVVRLVSPAVADTPVTITSNLPTQLANQSVVVPAGKNYAVFTATLANQNFSGIRTLTLTSTGGGEVRTSTFRVRSWTNAMVGGRNLNYTDGDGLTRDRELLSIPAVSENVLQVVNADQTTLFLKSDGTVWSVGLGSFGQHGDGTSGGAAVKTVPAQVPGLPVIKSIASIATSILAVDVNGEVWGWGQNSHGQTGAPGRPANTVVPTKVSGLANIVTAACSAFAGFAIDASGDIWSWGRGGDTGRASTTHIPAKVPGVPGPFVELGTGLEHAFAVHADGTLYGVGRNDSGQLGNGTYVNLTTMTAIPGVPYVTQIAGGIEHSVVMQVPPFGAATFVKSAGRNTYGQRGDGTAIAFANTTNTFGNVAFGSSIFQIGAGYRHSFYNGAGAVRSWGDGRTGQRVDGTFTASVATPTVIPATLGVSSVLGGANNSVALTIARRKGYNEALLVNGSSVSSANFRTGVVTALTGAAIPAGHTVVGGGELAGSTGTGEIVTMDGARALYRQEVVTNTIQASVAMGISLGATENLLAVYNLNGASRDDLVTVDSSTGEVKAQIWNGTAVTATSVLYTLGVNEQAVGIGDFNIDGGPDLLLFNTSTRLFTIRRMNTSGTFLGTSSILNAPLTPSVPVAVAAAAAGLVPIGCSDTVSGYGYNVVFLNSLGAYESWTLSRLNRVTTGVAGPVIPASYTHVAFWR